MPGVALVRTQRRERRDVVPPQRGVHFRQRRRYARGAPVSTRNTGSVRRLNVKRNILYVGMIMACDYQEIVTVEPGKRGGKPCVRGLCITVYEVLEYLASGMTIDEILVDFPDLTRDDIRACLAFAADRERRMVSIPPE